MSKLDEYVDKYVADLKELGVKPKRELVRAIAKGLGRAIYRPDARWVAVSDPKELARVRRNFLIKKLGLKDTPRLDAGIAEVKAQYTKRRKYRVVFYYLLTRRFRRSKVYA